jgi:hypothetical protein
VGEWLTYHLSDDTRTADQSAADHGRGQAEVDVDVSGDVGVHETATEEDYTGYPDLRIDLKNIEGLYTDFPERGRRRNPFPTGGGRLGWGGGLIKSENSFTKNHPQAPKTLLEGATHEFNTA